jgi:outer membrane receptor protein involved in Fe transport
MLSLGCALLLALPVLSQGIPTGTLTGRVTTSNGEGLPGVVVEVTSPSLQGSRSATTSENGDYIIPLLPPGEYQVKSTLEGFVAPERNLKISAAQTTKLDVEMASASVNEQIVVTGSYETISTSTQSSTTYEKSFVEELPVERNLRDTVLLAPGVAATGPGGARTRGISIAGSQSYESLFLVNGVVVNENLRGQQLNLFIEDAIEETTTSTSAISAEYGRFAGGVVNVITKSGGNELHGSFRTFLTNNDWEGKTPLTKAQTDKINKRYEATLGGFILKDRLWYFLAGRDFNDLNTRQTARTNVPYDTGTKQKRLEGKLTFAPFQGHRLTGSYIKIDEDELGNSFGTILDTASINDRSLPQELQALNYNGVFTDNFFVEAQYSERKFTFENSGSKFTDLIKGTLLVDTNTGERWWSPTFCGVCRPEKRNNKNYLGKASWFLSNDATGSHDIAFGYDTFDDVRIADNHQSGSDYRIIISNTLIKNGQLFPQILNTDPNTYIQYNPIFVATSGTHFKTDSLYANDRWRLNDHWSFNLGARYDKNNGKDAGGAKVASDSKLSPRLSLAWDPSGSGNTTASLSYAKYVTAIAGTQGNATTQAGNPAEIRWNYKGPSINADPNGALIPADQALQQLFNWFNSVGGTKNTSFLRSVNIPGGTTIIKGSLASPDTTEYALGFTQRLGSKGLFRADVIHREGHDFYMDRTDLGTGKVQSANGLADLAFIINSDKVERVYDGLLTQFQYRTSDRFQVGGNWTWSHARGNFDGETTTNGPIRATDLDYPEYKDPKWNNPRGDLLIDQRHRARAWVVYDLFNTEHHKLNASLLQSYATGLPYGAVGTVQSSLYVKNPGYVRPPTTVTYYFTGRDAFRTPNLYSTDVALNYSFELAALGKQVEFFLQPEVLNVFNRHAPINVDTSVSTIKQFNPFTEKPVEGVNWRKGSKFGQALTPDDFQQPRTFRFSVGIRF